MVEIGVLGGDVCVWWRCVCVCGGDVCVCRDVCVWWICVSVVEMCV